jgi:hypothetical protein
MEDRLAELERRFGRTEHRARLMFAMGLLMLVGAVMLVAAKPALTQTDVSTVKAPFRVVDDQGKVIMSVSGHRDTDGNKMSLYTWSGEVGVELRAPGAGGRLSIHGTDLNGTREGGDATLETIGDGARLRLTDSRNQLAASLAVGAKNRLFVLYDKDGHPIFRGGYGGLERGQIIGSLAP